MSELTMPSTTRAFRLCDLRDLSDPGARGFELRGNDGMPIAAFVVRRGERVFAYLDSCPHTGVGLTWWPDRYLDIEGEYLQCATHGALFTIDTGFCVLGPCAGASLTPLEVAVVDGVILVWPPRGHQGAGLG